MSTHAKQFTNDLQHISRKSTQQNPETRYRTKLTYMVRPAISYIQYISVEAKSD